MLALLLFPPAVPVPEIGPPASTGNLVNKAIYGSDSRQEHSAMPPEWTSIGDAVAMIYDTQGNRVFDSQGVFQYEQSLHDKHGDCDGTLVDSMGAWLPSWQAAACGAAPPADSAASLLSVLW